MQFYRTFNDANGCVDAQFRGLFGYYIVIRRKGWVCRRGLLKDKVSNKKAKAQKLKFQLA